MRGPFGAPSALHTQELIHMGAQHGKGKSQEPNGAGSGLFWFAVAVMFIFMIVWNSIK